MWSHEAGESYCERAGPTIHAHVVRNMTSLLVHQGNSSWIWRLLKIQCWLNKLLLLCFNLYCNRFSSSAEFHDTLLTSKLRAVKYGEWTGPANQPQWTYDLGLPLGPHPSAYPKTTFHRPLRCSPYFQLQFLSWAFIADLANCHVDMI